MKKVILFLALFTLIGRVSTSTAQNLEDSKLKIGEINKMVKLNPDQKRKLNSISERYVLNMDSALFKVTDQTLSAELIYQAKKEFDTKFMNLLSNKQRIEYTKNIGTPEVKRKTEAKINTLRKSGDYSEAELNKMSTEIFDYMMLEKIAYVCDKYNIERQKENIAQLKKHEPQSLKTANALQKAKHQGKTYQKGYKW